MMKGRMMRCLVAAAALWAPVGAVGQAVPAGSEMERGLRIEKVGSPERSFHTVSALIVGPTESLLWDAQYKLGDGDRVADVIEATGTTLIAIVLSHADHDHYMAAAEIVERFPDTPVYMSASGLGDFTRRSARDFEAERSRPDPQVPEEIVQPKLLPGPVLRVDGHEVHFIGGLTGDVRAPVSTVAWIPSLRTVLAGDLVFEGIHPWLGDADLESRVAWRSSLRRIAELAPAAVVPGHKRDATTFDDPEQITFMIRYLDDYDRFMASAASPEAVADSMVATYPELTLPVLMFYGARTWFKRRP